MKRKTLMVTLPLTAFPSLKYNLDQYLAFTGRINEEDTSIATDGISNTKNCVIYVIGATDKGDLQLLSKKRGKKKQIDISEWGELKAPLSVVPIVFFLGEEEHDENDVISSTREWIKQLYTDSSILFPVILVSRNGHGDINMSRDELCFEVKPVKEDVRRTLCGVLEMSIFESLRKIVELLEVKVKEIPKISLLLWEGKALLKHQNGLLTHSGKQKTYLSGSDAVTMPRHVVEILKRRREILTFGIFYDTFCIFLTDHHTQKLEDEISELVRDFDEDFFHKYLPKFYRTTFRLTKLLGQGSKIYGMKHETTKSAGANGSSKEDKPRAGGTGVSNFGSFGETKMNSATLGAVLKDKSTSSLYALVSWHLFPTTGLVAYAEIDENMTAVGKSVFCYHPGYTAFPDMSLVHLKDELMKEIDNKFYDEENRPRKTFISKRELSSIGKVYKRGAVSECTEGMIVSCQLMARENANSNFTEGFLVQGITGTFASPGDSGSVIYTHGPGHTTLEAVGLVSHGCLTIRDDSLLEDLKISEHDLAKVTFASKISSGFHEAKIEENLDLEFGDVTTSSSESDSDSE